MDSEEEDVPSGMEIEELHTSEEQFPSSSYDSFTIDQEYPFK